MTDPNHPAMCPICGGSGNDLSHAMQCGGLDGPAPGMGPQSKTAISSARTEEIAASLFRRAEHLDPSDVADFDANDFGWSKLSDHHKDFYRWLVRHVLREAGVSYEW